MKIARSGLLVLICITEFSALADMQAVQADQDGLMAANTGFAFDLLKQIAGKQPGGNVFVSPYSVSTVLQMVGDGAAGVTKQEMESVLHVNGLAARDTACMRLDQSITSGQSNVILNLANAIWFKQGVELKPEFVAGCTNYFQAKTGALDFASPQSAKIINDWAEANTHGRIKDIVQWPMNPLTRVILANAIYFKGRWAHEFDKSVTMDRAFTPLDGTQIQVPMMQQHGHFDYFQTQGFQAVCLPYAGGRLQMYLLLPDSGSDIKKLLAGFDGGVWQNKILPQFRNSEGTVALPRFKLNYDVILNEPLEALGMKDAFSADADFSAMSAEKLFLSEVKQKSFVEVNEEGTEAAAVTTVTLRAMAVMRPEKPFEMVLDHPFFFVIGDKTTHSILFMGIVSNPGAVASKF
ncbi:MAG TPA: serpin family protein [Candidatus Limnocylindrales bacterium]|nr:serpin family protein [Candidatus Limnocylindrales bacterium]